MQPSSAIGSGWMTAAALAVVLNCSAQCDAAPPLPLDGQIDFFANRVASRPNDYFSRAILGRLYLKAAKEQGDGNRYDDAEDSFRAGLKINPKDAGNQLGLSACLLAQHRFADALSVAKAVLEADPENVEALAASGDAQLELGDYDEAEAAFQKLHESLPTAPVLARLARIAEARGQQQAAIDLLAKALKQARGAGAEKWEQAWYQQQIGDLELQRGKLAEAAARYDEILRGNPLHITALPALALVHALQGRFEEAEKLYSRALKHRPSEQLLIAFGEVHQAQGEQAEARQIYAIAREHLEHAVDVEDLVKPEPQPATETKPATNAEHEHLHHDFPHSHSHRYAEAHQRQLSLFYSEHDLQPELALTLARRELKVRHDVYTHDALAWALFRNGLYEDAARASEEALKLGTRDAKLCYHAGMIQHRLKNREQALTLLKTAAEINPNFSLLDRDLARKTLQELEGKE